MLTMQATPSTATPLAGTTLLLQSSASPLAGQEDEDERPREILRLSSRLEDLLRDVRRTVEGEFESAERSLLARYRLSLDAQQREVEALAQRHEAAAEAMRLHKQQLEVDLQRQRHRWQEAVALLQSTRRRCAGRYALRRTWQAWRAGVAAAAAEQLVTQLTCRLRHGRVKGSVFAAWRWHAQQSWKERLTAHERAVAGTVQSKLAEQMEQQRASTAATVEQLRTQLAEEQRQRAYLQENLKRVFMRGVCALNFEAMSLLADGGITTAAAPEDEQQQQEQQQQQQQQQQQHQLTASSPPLSQRQKTGGLLEEPVNSVADDHDHSPSANPTVELACPNGSLQELRDGAGGRGRGHSPSTAVPEIVPSWADSATPVCAAMQPQRHEQLNSGLSRPTTHQASLESSQGSAAAAAVATSDAPIAARLPAGRSNSAVRSSTNGRQRMSSESGTPGVPDLMQRDVPLPARLCTASSSLGGYKRMVARESGPLPFVSYTGC